MHHHNIQDGENNGNVKREISQETFPNIQILKRVWMSSNIPHTVWLRTGRKVFFYLYAAQANREFSVSSVLERAGATYRRQKMHLQLNVI